MTVTGKLLQLVNLISRHVWKYIMRRITMKTNDDLWQACSHGWSCGNAIKLSDVLINFV